MATCTRRHHAPAFKVEVVWAIIRQDCRLVALAEQVATHPNQIQGWKKPLVGKAERCLERAWRPLPAINRFSRRGHARFRSLTRDKDFLGTVSEPVDG
ncbi:hypothetical protein [Candidatus Nitrospira neomarina]|uniref:Transposase n=1 Tax=Candidatus Nitrospira neomarina TaxID=3020899 RepID=A0AA96JVW6_9BACT|nr:hypothetical protein [Candidatus Nitrospira neomarina]WNM61888.1 hypothetical protein PQG83_19415 [Candidatus Nitrospira neomarina]